jgi:hypothetical protein
MVIHVSRATTPRACRAHDESNDHDDHKGGDGERATRNRVQECHDLLPHHGIPEQHATYAPGDDDDRVFQDVPCRD